MHLFLRNADFDIDGRHLPPLARRSPRAGSIVHGTGTSHSRSTRTAENAEQNYIGAKETTYTSTGIYRRRQLNRISRPTVNRYSKLAPGLAISGFERFSLVGLFPPMHPL